MEQENQTTARRLQGLIGRTMDLMEQILEDMGRADQEDRRVDTRSLKEFVSGLKELKSMLQEEQPAQEVLRVVFEAGEEDFNG